MDQSSPTRGGQQDEGAARTRGSGKHGSAADEKQPEKIRVELNIEKWPGIWQPAKAHTRLAVRTLERQVELQNGDQVSSKLIVGFTDLGALTTEDQRMFYALIRQWENSGKPFGRPVYFSDRVLSRLLRKKGWGTNVIEAITGSLRRLRLTPLRWIKSFHRSDEVGHQYEEEVPFQMLDDLKIVTRKAHGHITNQQGYFQFNRHIETNLQANYTKPLLEEVFFGLESEIAQLIYTHIDLIMFGKTRYERRTKELFADLGLTGASYRYKSNRKQKLQRALEELQGIRLNHGLLRSATIVETADGQDYKVVFVKGASRDAVPAPDDPALPGQEAVVINHYAKAKDDGRLQAEELVLYFHKTFHGITAHAPQLKETNQALSLVSQYGLVKAKHIVNFAVVEAAKTKFAPRNFGAVLNYVSAALADLDRHKQSAGKRASMPTPPPWHQQPEWVRGERRASALTIEQYGLRFERAKAELFKHRPFLAHRWKPGSALHERVIRARVVHALDGEIMDLMPAPWLPAWFRAAADENPPLQNRPL
jgi:hypothetical protein